MIYYSSLLRHFSILACFAASTVGHEAIVGGHVGSINEFPYQVSVQIDNVHNCGGGIIHNRFVLTAAHCLFVDGCIDDTPFFVIAGTGDLSDTAKPAVKVAVKKIFVPREYNDTDRIPNGDIAVLMLKRSFGLSVFSKQQNLKSLKLPKIEKDDGSRSTVEIAGFGWNYIDTGGLDEFGSSDKQLRQARVKVFKYCRPDGQTVYSRLICASIVQERTNCSKGYKRRGTCTGDSGSPLVRNRKTVIGILSLSEKGCSESERENTISIYTRVASYLKFITDAMKDKHFPYIKAVELRRRQ